MDVMQAIRTRESVREFKDTPVDDPALRRILEAGRLAPSASNRQEWRYIVVRDADTRQKLMEAAKNQKFVGEAPVVIVACAVTDNHTMTCGQLCYPIDVAISVDHMTLQAVEEGLGTCWIGAFYEERVKEIMDIPGDVRVVAMLPLGYPKSIRAKKARMEQDKIVMFEKWEQR